MFQRACDFQNLIAQHVGRFRDLRVPEPKNMPTMVFQPLSSLMVTELVSRKVMLPAIELDDQTDFRTGEVRYIRTYRVLAAKFEPIRSLPQQ